MLDWLKQRVISWLLSRTVGKWIAIDRQNLHAVTGLTNEWTLVATDLAVQPNCLSGYDVPFRVKRQRTGVKGEGWRWRDGGQG